MNLVKERAFFMRDNINLKGLTKKEKLAIIKYKNILLERFPKKFRRLLLFGSKARGDSNRRTSDVDLLVVVSGNTKEIGEEAAILTHEPIARYMVDISPITVEERFFKTWSPLLSHVNKDGITLWKNANKKR